MDQEWKVNILLHEKKQYFSDDATLTRFRFIALSHFFLFINACSQKELLKCMKLRLYGVELTLIIGQVIIWPGADRGSCSSIHFMPCSISIPLKTSENLQFSDIFRRYRNGILSLIFRNIFRKTIGKFIELVLQEVLLSQNVTLHKK